MSFPSPWRPTSRQKKPDLKYIFFSFFLCFADWDGFCDLLFLKKVSSFTVHSNNVRRKSNPHKSTICWVPERRFVNHNRESLCRHPLQQTTTTDRRHSPIVLFAKSKASGSAKRRNGGGGGASAKTKKNKLFASTNSRPNKSKKPNTEPTITVVGGSSSGDGSNNRNKNSKPAPPWQVLSTKEAKVNIEKEKERRELARQGIQQHNSDENHDDSSPATLSKSFLSDADHKYLKWKRFNPVTTPNGMRFVGSYMGGQPSRRPPPLPPPLGVPEIAFLGRSNVGKSSLLNRLGATASNRASSSDQARVGKTPGATASVNLYALTSTATNAQKKAVQPTTKAKPSSQPNVVVTKDLLGLVDLPGFGYAKLSKEIQESVQQAAEFYLANRREIALGILLVDIRRIPPSDDDRAVLAALYDMGLPILVLATKIDKLKSKNQLEQHLQAIQQGLGLPPGQPLAVSSVTGEGIKPLWNIILEACETSVGEFQTIYEDDKKNGLSQDGDDNDPDAMEIMDNDDEVYYGDEDDDDMVYEQGYDWIHDEYFNYDPYDPVDDEESNQNGRYEIDEEGGLTGNLDDQDDEDWMNNNAAENKVDKLKTKRMIRSENWRSLKQQARDMERRKQV